MIRVSLDTVLDTTALAESIVLVVIIDPKTFITAHFDKSVYRHIVNFLAKGCF